VKQSDGTLRSTQFIKAEDGKEYFAVLLSATEGHVECTADKKQYGVRGTSPHKLKIAIKTVLVSLGCAFETETRKKSSDEVKS
jgi:hypothetical protein